MVSIVRSRATRTLAVLAVTVMLAGGCAATRVGSATAPSPAIASEAIPTQAPTPSAAAVTTSAPSGTLRPTPTYPARQSRPTGIPVDGTCESGSTCLGLLDTAKHHTNVFAPGFAFTMPGSGWENISQEGGVFAFLPIAAPGDGIFFFRAPQATKADGTVLTSVPIEVEAIKQFLTTNADLTVSTPQDVTIGGLPGVQMDISVPPGAGQHPGDCPVATCVMFFKGRDPSSKPTWQWDWGVTTSERMRLYLLKAKDTVVAIVADSLDGTTWDDLTATTDKLLKTVAFDRS